MWLAGESCRSPSQGCLLVPPARGSGATRASLVAQTVKNLLASAGDLRDMGTIPGLGRSPGGGHGNPLQYSCLENPMDRGAWRAAVHGGTKELDPSGQLNSNSNCGHIWATVSHGETTGGLDSLLRRPDV